MAIVSNDECELHLRLDSAEDYFWLTSIIPTVESAIIRWLGDEARLYDSNGELIPCVKLAALVEIAYQYRFREGAENTKMIDWYRQGFTLSTGATALLQPLRMPRIA